ncbi:MAG: hypothetical protein DRH20_08320 [Deltaproteobacteria bacterium]|nr:MAG: hypothetical protein DRH20_08320 [Deltaproteobacteria bacterium]
MVRSRPSMKTSLSALLLLAGLLAPLPTLAGNSFGKGATVWKELRTRHTIVMFRSRMDLETLEARLRLGPALWGPDRLYGGSSGRELEDLLAQKIDAVYERVQEILDMRRKIGRTRIRIYPTRADMEETYVRAYRKPCPYRAWYVFEINTVFLNIEDVHTGILAHELAHSIVDHYLLVRPPPRAAEILARYVDRHLAGEGTASPRISHVSGRGR